jgi:hypothetical protein
MKVTLKCHYLHPFLHPLSPLLQREVKEVTVKQEEKTFL